MKAKKDTVKKFVGGGALIQAGLGAAQTAYGMAQLPRARQEFERAKAAAPSLETPSQYYENYKNAYDSELARMESEAVQGNLATSVKALQGAGGRALVGGLGASVAQSQAARNAMLQQERAARLQAGQDLARAQEAAIERKEVRSQQDISYANQAYQAALGNIGSGISAIGEAGMYGAFDGLGQGIEDFMKDLSPNMKKFAENTEMYSQERLSQDAKIRADFEAGIPKVDLTQSLTRPVVGEGSLGETMEMEQKIRDRKIAEKELQDAIDASKSKGKTSPSGQGITQMDSQKTENMRDLGMKIKGAVPSIYETLAGTFLKSNPLTSWMTPGLGATLLYTSSKENGGMMLDGQFSHEKNPIDIVQNGVKVGEATGSEYIVNPEQAKKIAAQSAYAKKLFKRFEKQAKKKK